MSKTRVDTKLKVKSLGDEHKRVTLPAEKQITNRGEMEPVVGMHQLSLSLGYLMSSTMERRDEMESSGSTGCEKLNLSLECAIELHLSGPPHASGSLVVLRVQWLLTLLLPWHALTAV